MVWPFLPGITVRLHQAGCVNRPFFLLGVVARRRRPCQPPDKPPLDEVIGCYDRMPNERNEIIASVDLKRLAYYMGKGAVLSNGLEEVLGLAGFLPISPRMYSIAWQKRQIVLEKGELTEEDRRKFNWDNPKMRLE